MPTDKDDARGDKILAPLSEVAGAETGSGPSTIRRKDLQRLFQALSCSRSSSSA